MVNTEPDYSYTTYTTVLLIYWKSYLCLYFKLPHFKRQTLKKMWCTLLFFCNIYIFQRKKKVNRALFTISNTETDRWWNEAENQGFLKVSQKPEVLFIQKPCQQTINSDISKLKKDLTTSISEQG